MDYLPVYLRWMHEVGRTEHSSLLFGFWLYTLSVSQVMEVKNKGLDAKHTPELFPDVWGSSKKTHLPDVRALCDEVLSYRNEATLLVNETHCTPIDDPKYAKILLDTYATNEPWRKASAPHLEKAITFFNKINHNWLPYWDPKIASLCQNIIAERALLGL